MIEIRKPDVTLAKLLPSVRPCPDINYIPSQYALPFEQGGKRYVFNNLTKQCVEGELPSSARAGEEYDDLIRAQFLVPEGKDECAYYNQISSDPGYPSAHRSCRIQNHTFSGIGTELPR